MKSRGFEEMLIFGRPVSVSASESSESLWLMQETASMVRVQVDGAIQRNTHE